MYNIFETSKQIINKLTGKEKRNYWEKTDNNIKFNHSLQIKDPKTGSVNIYDEQEMFEEILESDRKRLLKFQ